MSKRMGRPPKKPSEKQTCRFMANATPAQARAILRAMKERDLTASQLLIWPWRDVK
jgi:hypothetical protein